MEEILSAEYSAASAWLLNFNNGNQNNNNKYNSYYARGVAASQNIEVPFVLFDYDKESFDESIINSYYKCLLGKSNSKSALKFLPDYRSKLLLLADSIYNHNYHCAPYSVFVAKKPTWREIWYSELQDRVLDTWMGERVEPLMDIVLLPNVTACRSGKGGKAMKELLVNAVKECSQDYTHDCWIMHYDLKSYYMSITKILLLQEWISLIEMFYSGPDKEILKYCLTVRLMTDPTINCVRKSPLSLWKNFLPPHKSLFTRPKGIGIPIGLQLTNESANLYPSPVDYYIVKELGYNYYNRSIDDSFIIADNKDKLLQDMQLIRSKYAEFGLTVHPNKYSIQHYSKGFKALGIVIKPGRVYIGNRSLDNCFRKIHWWNEQAKDNIKFQIENAEKFVGIVNSYLGMMQPLDEFNNRRKISESIFEIWNKVLYPDRQDFKKLTVRKRYKTKSRIRRRMKRIRINYLKTLNDMKSQPIFNSGPTEKAIAKEKISETQWIGRANIQDFTEEIQSDGGEPETRIVEGMKTWIEQRYDHEPSTAELQELSNY